MKKESILNNYEWYHGWKRILIHILFWTGIILIIWTYQNYLMQKHDWISLGYILITIMSIHYILTLYAVPKILVRGDSGRFFLFLICINIFIIILIFLILLLSYYFKGIAVGSNRPLLYMNNSVIDISKDSIQIYTTIMFNPTLYITLLIKIAKDNIISNGQRQKLENKNKELMEKNLKLELQFLKSQVRPHFFFNALNNIYSLINEKDKAATEIVLRLSDLMRYSLYEASKDKILLKKEIEFLSDYLALEKIRHKKNSNISLKILGSPGDHVIPPLIFIPFVENSFKHGVDNSFNPCRVNITIKIGNEKLIFCVENRKRLKPQKSNSVGGIGLTNVKRRLDLMFPNRYTLNVQDESLKYIVTLNLQLYEKPEVCYNRRRTISTKPY